MRKERNKVLSFVLCCAMLIGMLPTAAFATEEPGLLDPQYTYRGAGMTFEKISHVNTDLEEPDGVVDYAGNGSIAIHDPNAETDLVGDRGQSYSYAAASYGDWVYIGTMYGGLGAANIISGAMTQAGMDRETALAVVNTMYNGRLYISEPDGKNAGGIFFKFNVKTGETVILLSKDLNGIIPTFRSACEMNGKLYFVGMIQDVDLMAGEPSVTMPAYYGIDMLNEAILYQNGLPVIYEVTPSDDPDGDILTRIYDCVGGDLDVYKSMVRQNMFTSTRAIGIFEDTLIAGCMDENGPFLAASSDPSGGQETFHEIADLDDLFGYTAFKRNDASGGGGIYQVVEYNDKLYVAIVSGHASTMNPETGTMRSFAIIRGECNGDPTDKSDWEWSVLVGDEDDGAKYPFGIDETRVSCVACTLQVYNDHLYIGDYNDVSSALQGFISRKNFTTQATNLEQSLNLYRMDEDEEIEMVVGDPNPTFPDGGISGWGSGYESHMNQYHWQTTVYDGKMYLSTMDTTSLLAPLAQFTNGDILEMDEEEWMSQVNYIRVLLELMTETTDPISEPESSSEPIETFDPDHLFGSDKDFNEEYANLWIDKATEYARYRAKESINSMLDSGEEVDEVEQFSLSRAQRKALMKGLEDETIRPGRIARKEMDRMTRINSKMHFMGFELDNRVSEDFLEQYTEVLNELVAQEDSIPESVKGLYNMLVSFATKENLEGIVTSLPYLSSSEIGFDLYSLEERSNGSVRIKTVSNDGFGDRNNHGLRVFTETDDYLVIGTANPFYGTQIWRTAGEIDSDIDRPTWPDFPIWPDRPDRPDRPIWPDRPDRPDDDDDDDDSKPSTKPDTDDTDPGEDTVVPEDDGCPLDETCPLAQFDDTDPLAWYHDGVHYCLDEGLMNGVSDKLFAPNATMTRAMVWTVLARMEGIDTTGGAIWYEAGQTWAIENGISDGSNPNGAITREQLITMLWRYMNEPSAHLDALAPFADATSISTYATKAMAWSVESGLMNGDNGNLKPANNATRAEVATILYRFCENIIAE